MFLWVGVFQIFSGTLLFLSFGVPHLVAFLAVAYEFADVLAHGWPKIFGRNAFVSA
jgi:hypothetical protein